MGKSTTRAVIVDTVKGKLKGYTSDDVKIFLGIKYANAKRWQMPVPAAPWEGVKNCFGYGFGSPSGSHLPGDETMMPLRFWPENENCQFLNIWTKSVEPGVKKPVLVWFHGGGYAMGSAMEHMYYDGEALCNANDVVVVTINHRLNILGYLDLSAFGEQFWNSANVGNADIVASLQWVKENIDRFGGDPDNVTIFGQSGGGAKVRDMLQTPAADGLYHKAIVQSGVIASMADIPADHNGKAIVTALMEDLGFTDIAQLVKVAYPRLLASYEKVAPGIFDKGEYIGGNPLPNSWFLGDCTTHPMNPYSLTVPTMIGTAFAEFSYALAPENKYEMTEAEMMAFLETKYAEKTPVVAELFRKAWPDKVVADAMIADEFMRLPSLRYAHLLAEHSKAPVYMYMYSYETNMEHTAAWHLGEIPFVFRNVHMVPRLIEEGVSDVLEDKIANSWAAFAATGNPWHNQLPQWPVTTAKDDYTMIFDRKIRISKNFDREFQDYMGVYFPQSLIMGAVGNSHEDELSEEEKQKNKESMRTTLKDKTAN